MLTYSDFAEAAHHLEQREGAMSEALARLPDFVVAMYGRQRNDGVPVETLALLFPKELQLALLDQAMLSEIHRRSLRMFEWDQQHDLESSAGGDSTGKSGQSQSDSE